jgi:hypothetical protein
VRRIFWLALGLGAGATAVVMMGRWAKKQARAMAPPNLARQAGETLRDAGSLVGEVLKEFRTGMAEKEAEFRASLGE